MSAEGGKAGVVAALGAVAVATRGDDAAQEQLDLLSVAEEVGGGPLDEALLKLGEGLRGKPRRGRGAGRPAGAVNRSTVEWRRFFLSQRRDPAFVLADLYSLPVEELAARLQCERSKALSIQLSAATALLPYLHQRLPQAVQVSSDGSLPTLTIVMGATGGSVPATASGPVIDLFCEVNQYVSSGKTTDLDSVELDKSDHQIENKGIITDQAADLGSVA